jgi:hypothetical protein
MMSNRGDRAPTRDLAVSGRLPAQPGDQLDGGPYAGRRPILGHMVTCKPVRGWLWYQRITIAICAGGGGAMLIGAAIADSAASVPLLVIGGAWSLLGLAGIWQARRQVREITVDAAHVVFRYQARSVVIPAREITEIGWARWDPNRAASLRFRTLSHGVIKAPPRMQGFIDFLIELRRINPDVKVPD